MVIVVVVVLLVVFYGYYVLTVSLKCVAALSVSSVGACEMTVTALFRLNMDSHWVISCPDQLLGGGTSIGTPYNKSLTTSLTFNFFLLYL